MKTVRYRIGLGACVLAALAGLIVGLMLAQCGADRPGGSRIAWPASETLERHPPKS